MDEKKGDRREKVTKRMRSRSADGGGWSKEEGPEKSEVKEKKWGQEAEKRKKTSNTVEK